MKTQLAVLLTTLIVATGAFAGQPAAQITFNNKGQVVSVIRTPVAAPAPAASCASGACCAK